MTGFVMKIKKQLIPKDELLLAAGEGFEPSRTESESGVLPLHKPAMFILLGAANTNYYSVESKNVNRFLKNISKTFAADSVPFCRLLGLLNEANLRRGNICP